MLKRLYNDGTYSFHEIEGADQFLSPAEAIEFAGDMLKAAGGVLIEQARDMKRSAAKIAKAKS